MGASNYLAVRTDGGRRAFISALYTGVAYMATCAVLIVPFFVFENRAVEMVLMFAIAVAEIFGFNYYLGRVNHRPYMRKFLEMLGVCAGVSVIAFLIGLGANKCFGI